MEAVPNELLRKAYERKPIYLYKIPLAYGLWALTVWALYAAQGQALFIPVGVACSIFIAYLIRGLGAIAHDAVHGNVTKNKFWSYVVALLCWAPTGMSLTVYANYHLHHHKIANTYADVDNFVVTDYVRSAGLAKALLLVVYTVAYPVYFLFQMFRYIPRLSPWHRVRVNLEVIGFFSLVAMAGYFMPFGVFFFVYPLPFILGAILASVTSLIEHYEMMPGEDAYSSRTYGTSAHITNFLWNNVTYHNEHHKFPGIPWYNLRSFHEQAYPYYDAQVKAACHPGIWGLAFQLYGRILKLDLSSLEHRYASVNPSEERHRVMGLPGIQSETLLA